MLYSYERAHARRLEAANVVQELQKVSNSACKPLPLTDKISI